MQFLIEHHEAIIALLGTAYALVCGIVALTPTREDDRALARFQQRISLLQPRNVPGVLKMPGKRPGRTEDAFPPMLIVLLVIAPLLGACAGRQAVALDTARATACIQAEDACIRRAESGDISVADAEACVACTRATCDAMRERLVRE